MHVCAEAVLQNNLSSLTCDAFIQRGKGVARATAIVVRYLCVCMSISHDSLFDLPSTQSVIESPIRPLCH